MGTIENTSHILPMNKKDYEAYVNLMIRRIDQTEYMLHKRVREEVQTLLINQAQLQECLNK